MKLAIGDTISCVKGIKDAHDDHSSYDITERKMITALTVLAVLIASMFLATMGAAISAMHREQVEATETARSRTKR
ncbi:MAG: hypothetical protein GY789_06080 [Hyphomicrobiales bacterium]|nr:hypothetical protein [Hyphomicrobiales bacterium]MCP4998289.1 hypothetical protein [Hyphomicrobiales bacterium]